MILIDISSILHRMVFGSTKDASKLRIENEKYVTEDFIYLTMHYIVEELITCQLKYREYGEMVLCFDDYKKDYWRRDVDAGYKSSRKVARDVNPVNYKEVFEYTNALFEQFQENTPWKCVYVNRAEADDIILILAKEYHHEGILIYSPDKDFLQSQRLPNIKQYSALTRKWLVPENKHDNMDHWITEHVMLGDVSDGVPKVTDHTEFTDVFKDYLTTYIDKIQQIIEKNNMKETIDGCEKFIDIMKVHNFHKLPDVLKNGLVGNYDVMAYNRKGQEIGLDIFDNKGFGPTNIEKIQNGSWKKKLVLEDLKAEQKLIKEEMKLLKESKQDLGECKQKVTIIKDKIANLTVDNLTANERLEEFLDSHPMYREHYDRNFTLVMEEGIPDYIRKNIMMEFKSAKTDYNADEFDAWLDCNNMTTVKASLPKVFTSTESLDISNCGW